MDLAEELKLGKVAVIPTDTIYGIVGSALNKSTVERIYILRKRTPSKPMIVLISSLDDLKLFNIEVDEVTKNLLRSLWPNPVSVILPCNDPKFEYLHRGTNTLAFRMPRDDKLLEILKASGPLVAPSANFEGEKPAETIKEAKNYFGDEVDLYVDGSTLKGQSSTLVEIKKGKINILRQGAFKIPNS